MALDHFSPLRDVIIAEAVSTDEAGETAIPGGRIIKPGTATDDIGIARVMSSGAGKTENGVVIPNGVAVGDVISYDKRGARDWHSDGKKCLMIEALAVFGIWTEGYVTPDLKKSKKQTSPYSEK